MTSQKELEEQRKKNHEDAEETKHKKQEAKDAEKREHDLR